MTAADFTDELAETRRSEALADTLPCAEHPDAPVINGACGGCTQYPADMLPAPAASVPQPRRTPPPRLRAPEGADHCADCGKPLRWASPDGLGPVCRAKRAAAANRPEELL